MKESLEAPPEAVWPADRQGPEACHAHAEALKVSDTALCCRELWRGSVGGRAWEEMSDLTCPAMGPAFQSRRAGRELAILGGSPIHSSPSAAMAWGQTLQVGGYCPGVASFTPAFKALLLKENVCLILPVKPQHIIYVSYCYLFFLLPEYDVVDSCCAGDALQPPEPLK